MFELTPFRRRELSGLRRDFEGLLDRFFEDWPRWRESGQWWPSVDVAEDKDKLTVTAEVPGLEAEDIDISLTGETLTIKGEKKRESEAKEENYHRVERSYGSFVRSFRLPAEVDPDKVKASYKKGVLTLTLPKAAEAKSKKIHIEAK